MSLFRRERVFASVELDRIALVKLAGGAGGATACERMIEGQLDPDHPHEALREASAVLADPQWRGTMRHIVLSDRLARYLIIERPQGARSVDELRLAVEARFEAAFDASATDWEIGIDARPLARRFVACGVSRRLLDATRGAFSESGECASIRPYLVCELNRLAKRLPAKCWFATAARDYVAVTAINSGECQHIRVLPIDSTMPRAIAETIERERMLSGDLEDNERILLSGILDAKEQTGTLTRLDAPQWRAQPASWSPSYRLALAEIWA